MHENINLTEIALVVVAALTGGIALSRLRQPAILGYILSGIILGPSGFALIRSRDQVGVLAELGVLLLLFVVGMELSLRTFKKVWGIATLCTILQILLSITITVTLSNMFSWSLGLSLLLGFVASVSSTAVVVKMLESLGELKSETGQLTIGILIAQDLAIVPMILILRNYGESWFNPMLFVKVLGSIGMIVALINYLSRRQRVRLPLTQMIAGEKDLTALASMTFCFAAAAVSGLIGLSAPYGAFLAGLVLGNTHERVIMLETIKPVQSILMMAFFLSIGLLLDIEFIWQHLWHVLLLLFVITVGKTALNIGILRVLHLPWSQAFLVGVVLAQLGEFAFLMATISNETHIINEFGERLIIGLTVLSLAFSPLWLASAKRLRDLADVNSIPLQGVLSLLSGEKVSFLKKAIRFVRLFLLKRPPRQRKLLPKPEDLKDHPEIIQHDPISPDL
ncbi:MAG: cation:proton antiporter [Alphaproteobacteria bacterium]|nr:cation:proton antiporter [Alphaproteobacteria bacterium]